MLRNIFTTILIFVCLGASGLIFGQTGTGGQKPTYVIGDLAAINDKKFTVNTKAGPVDIIVADKTDFKRASADNLSFATATAGAITDISVGDKLTISGFPAADGKSINARTVYFITRADVAAKNAKESAEWSKRGISGKVKSVSEQNNEIDVEIRSLTGTTNLKLTPKSDAKYLRYAPDSEKFNEAKDSSLAEVKAGDMIRALGDKSSDGLTFTAEKVLTGAFQTVAGTVVSIDEAKNEVVIKNLQTKKDITVEVTDTSLLKKYPAELAERMAGFQSGMGGGARPAGQGGGARPAGPPAGGDGQAPGGAQGRGGFGGPRPGGAGGGNIDEMLEKFPTIKPADLKVGDMIAVSSTKNASIDRIRAIKLLAGVEPFLRMAQAGNGRGRGGQGGGVEQGFTIPGLDGIGFP